jgi:ubiquinone/menaquinone biosynthesis C-methylase UbiE
MWSVSDAVALRVALQEERAADLAGRVQRLLAPFSGEERALDVGCGTGALAYALAPNVREVVGVDSSAELLDAARERAPHNCTFLEADATALPFGWGEFDLVGCVRVLHHVRRPELVVAELARVTRRGGRLLVADQLGDVDPIRSIEYDRFERLRDPSHTRLLPDGDIRASLDANNLVVLSDEIVREQRDLEHYLDIAGLEGEQRERIRGLAPGAVYEVEIGWYVARKL